MRTNKLKYPGDSGFKVPEDYFETFDERMMEKLKGKSSFEFPASRNAFSVPEGYFDGLEDSIIKKTKEEKPVKVISLLRRQYMYYAAAVAAIFVLMLGNFFQVKTTDQPGWDDIEISVMENYIDEGYEMGYIDFNSMEYSEFISEDGTLIDDSDFKKVNTQDALEYLDENMEDPAYILE